MKSSWVFFEVANIAVFRYYLCAVICPATNREHIRKLIIVFVFDRGSVQNVFMVRRNTIFTPASLGAELLTKPPNLTTLSILTFLRIKNLLVDPSFCFEVLSEFLNCCNGCRALPCQRLFSVGWDQTTLVIVLSLFLKYLF